MAHKIAIALKIVRELESSQFDYLSSVRESANQGHSPSHCIHGTYLWTEYDAICGHCEDGIFDAYSTKAEILKVALDMATDRIAQRRAYARKANTEIHTLLAIARDQYANRELVDSIGHRIRAIRAAR